MASSSLRPGTPEFEQLRPFDQLVAIMAELRSENGCPWDLEQTHLTLTRYLEEEAYEAVEAIEALDFERMREELGDVMLQIVFHAQLANEEGRFDADGVCRAINEKMIRRHPHVFGDAAALGTSSEVLQRWEQIKLAEKGASKRESLLDGIPKALPALLQSERVQGRAADVGFDWPDVTAALAKISEELEEVRGAASHDQAEEEIGDLLFATVSAARKLGVNPETALRRTVRKFSDRFRAMEAQGPLAGLAPEELLRRWRGQDQSG